MIRSVCVGGITKWLSHGRLWSIFDWGIGTGRSFNGQIHEAHRRRGHDES